MHELEQHVENLSAHGDLGHEGVMEALSKLRQELNKFEDEAPEEEE